jgi:hypothetical protein
MSDTNPQINIAPGSIPVPKDWAALGMDSGYSPKAPDKLRLWVTGPSGEGKSTFTRSIPNSVTLDFGDETGGIVEPRGFRIWVKSYDHYMKVTDKLIAEAGSAKPLATRVIFDNVDDWMTMIINRLQDEKSTASKPCDDIMEYGSAGHGVALVRNRCWSRIQALFEAGLTWTCTGNLTEKHVTKPGSRDSTTVLRPVVFPSMASMFRRRAEFHMVIYCKKETVPIMKKSKLPSGQVVEVEVGSETRPVYVCDCRSTDAAEAKSRGVPEMKTRFQLPLVDGWKVFSKEYLDAVEATKKMITKEKQNG